MKAGGKCVVQQSSNGSAENLGSPNTRVAGRLGSSQHPRQEVYTGRQGECRVARYHGGRTVGRLGGRPENRPGRH